MILDGWNFYKVGTSIIVRSPDKRETVHSDNLLYTLSDAVLRERELGSNPLPTEVIILANENASLKLANMTRFKGWRLERFNHAVYGPCIYVTSPGDERVVLTESGNRTALQTIAYEVFDEILREREHAQVQTNT